MFSRSYRFLSMSVAMVLAVFSAQSFAANAADTCVDDSTFTFRNYQGVTVDCYWIWGNKNRAAVRIAKWCVDPSIKSACCHACTECTPDVSVCHPPKPPSAPVAQPPVTAPSPTATTLAPVKAPVVVQPTSCTDSSTYRFTNGQGVVVDCYWIWGNKKRAATRIAKWCVNPAIKTACCHACTECTPDVSVCHLPKPPSAPVAQPPVTAPSPTVTTLAPVKAPVVVQNPSCTDSTTYRFTNGQGVVVDCYWIWGNENRIAARISEWCVNTQIKNACCNTCSRCTPDKTWFQFRLTTDGSTQTCSWITKNNTKQASRRATYCTPGSDIADKCATSCFCS